MPSKELEEVIRTIRERDVLEAPTLDEMRQGFVDLAAEMPPADDVSIEGVTADSVPSEWVTVPDIDDDRAVLYLHGGGYVIGSPVTHRELAGRLSRACGARVLLADYRLAPEHPFPAAVDDAVASYRWLLDTGYAPSGIVVAGDSAGGGLTVATLVALRDAGLPLPAAGVCLSPWVDLEGLGESMTARAHLDPIVQKEGLVNMAQMYVGEGGDPRTPLAAPLYADLAGLPPLLIQVGTAETLLDDATRLAAKAKQVGVEVTLEEWDDMIHVFQLFASRLAEGQQAIEKIGAYVREHTGAGVAQRAG